VTPSVISAAVYGNLYRQAVPLAPETPDVLAGRTAEAWQLWNTSRFQRTEVGAILPSLIADVEDALRRAEGSDRRNLSAVAASAYGLAQMLCANAAPSETYWIVLDRCVRAAQSADTPEMLAMASWVAANGLRHRDPDEAWRIVDEAASDLRPRLESGSDDMRGIFGALSLSLAMTAAKFPASMIRTEAWFRIFANNQNLIGCLIPLKLTNQDQDLQSGQQLHHFA